MPIQSDVASHFLRQKMHRKAANHSDNYSVQSWLLGRDSTKQDGVDIVTVTFFETWPVVEVQISGFHCAYGNCCYTTSASLLGNECIVSPVLHSTSFIMIPRLFCLRLA